MADGFQSDAFQNDAFQADAGAPPVIVVPPVLPTMITRAQSGALYDQYLEPITLDYVDGPDVDGTDGAWLETADSRTAMMIMLETRLGTSYSAPRDGTKIGEMLASGDPVTPEIVAAECTRAAGELERVGMISDFAIAIKDANGAYLTNGAGRLEPILRWTDRATGTPVDLAYAPFTGGG